jgi:hypothetical protein
MPRRGGDRHQPGHGGVVEAESVHGRRDLQAPEPARGRAVGLRIPDRVGEEERHQPPARARALPVRPVVVGRHVRAAPVDDLDGQPLEADQAAGGHRGPADPGRVHRGQQRLRGPVVRCQPGVEVEDRSDAGHCS